MTTIKDFFANSSTISSTNAAKNGEKFSDFSYSSTSHCDDWNGTSDSNNTCGGIIPFCKQMLLEEIGGHSVRYWDIAILIPNVLFLCFLLYKVRRIREKLRSTSSPIFTVFYILVYMTTIVSILRCIVSMAISASDLDGDIADKILWLILEFFLLTAELSVLTFGVFFGHLDSKTSMRRVLAATTIVSFCYTAVESALEFASPDEHYASNTKRIVLFSHGGMLYWMASAAILALAYAIICILPYTPLKNRIRLPAKRRFYVYCAFLACLYSLQFLGATLIRYEDLAGICVVTFALFVKLAFYTPVVYVAFLRGYVANVQPSLMFEYKRQKDEVGGGGELPDTGNYYPGMPGFASSGTGPSNYYDEVLFNQSDPFYDSTDLNSPAANPEFVDPFIYRPAIGGSLVIEDGGGDEGAMTPEQEPLPATARPSSRERNELA